MPAAVAGRRETQSRSFGCATNAPQPPAIAAEFAVSPIPECAVEARIAGFDFVDFRPVPEDGNFIDPAPRPAHVLGFLCRKRNRTIEFPINRQYPIWTIRSRCRLFPSPFDGASRLSRARGTPPETAERSSSANGRLHAPERSSGLSVSCPKRRAPGRWRRPRLTLDGRLPTTEEMQRRV